MKTLPTQLLPRSVVRAGGAGGALRGRGLVRAAALSSVLASVLGLGGCFGGSDDETPPDPLAVVPDSATASTDGLVAYQKSLAASGDADVREPIDVTAVVLPTSDTTEPSAVE